MFPEKAIEDARQHAVLEYPKESAGIIFTGEYIPLPNTHEDPESHFRVDAALIAGFFISGEIEAIIHSHPDGERCPTKIDMERQIDSAVPWGVMSVSKERGASRPVFWGDQLPIPPLLEREFIPGVTDCYALVRDWYRLERGVTLPLFPRDNNWWNEGENIVADNFAAFGFYQIPTFELPGDCAIAPVLSTVENHCALYLGEGLILHHMAGTLSRRDPCERWMRRITRFFRYGGPNA